MIMERQKDIVQNLATGLDASIAFFRALTQEQLDTQIYADGGRWTTRQMLAHFITIEKSMHWLFRDLLAGGAGTPDEFDLDRFNLTQVPKLDPLSLDELIDRFRAVRRGTIQIAEELTDGDLDRRGMHPFLGTGTLERFIRWAYEHVRLHEADIRRTLGI